MYKIKVNTPQEVNQQEQDFQALLSRLGKISLAEAKAILEDRDVVEPESELIPDIIARFQKRIGSSKSPVIS